MIHLDLINWFSLNRIKVSLELISKNTFFFIFCYISVYHKEINMKVIFKIDSRD